METGFKGTKGPLELKYVSGICIGIGTVGDYSEMTANSIIPDSDNRSEVQIMEADMLLYSCAPEMLEALVRIKAELLRCDILDERTEKFIDAIVSKATGGQS